MNPAILIFPKELKNKIGVDMIAPYMHFVAELDGSNVHILKDRFGYSKEISFFNLGEYLNKVIYLGAGLYSEELVNDWNPNCKDCDPDYPNCDSCMGA